jgi:hypothetical protein
MTVAAGVKPGVPACMTKRGVSKAGGLEQRPPAACFTAGDED